MKSILEFLQMETPFYMVVAVSFFVSGLVFYFFSPQPPKVVYTFDAEKLKRDMMERLGGYLGKQVTIDPQVIDRMAEDIRFILDSYAYGQQTIVLNKRAVISSGLPNVKFVDITFDVEKKLFEKYSNFGVKKLENGSTK